MKFNFIKILTICGLSLAVNSILANAVYTPQTGILNIPAIEVNRKIEYINVRLQAQPDGRLSIISAEIPPSTIGMAETGTTINDTITFKGENVRSIIHLSDGSMWEVKGSNSCDPCGGTGVGRMNLTIRKGSATLSSPTNGVKTDYFMMIDGISKPFYIEKVAGYIPIALDQIEFRGENVRSIIHLSNGSMWEIKGSNSCDPCGGTGVGRMNLTIRKGSATLSSPTNGVKTDYFMMIDGISKPFYVNPL